MVVTATALFADDVRRSRESAFAGFYADDERRPVGCEPVDESVHRILPVVGEAGLRPG